MLRRLGKFGFLVALVVAAIGVLFVGGMRMRSPMVINTVRRVSRTTNKLAMRSAGTPGAYASVIHHVGRKSGRGYATPVAAVPTDDGFVIALPYGPEVDWARNVLAAGTATIVHEGNTIEVAKPEVLPLTETMALFPPDQQRTLRRFGVVDSLRVARA